MSSAEVNHDHLKSFEGLEKAYVKQIEAVRRLVSFACKVPIISAVVSPAIFLPLYDKVTVADFREALLAILACGIFAVTKKVTDQKLQPLAAQAPYLTFEETATDVAKKPSVIELFPISERIIPLYAVGQLALGAAWVFAHHHIYDEGNHHTADSVGAVYFVQLLLSMTSIWHAYKVWANKLMPFSKHISDAPMRIWDQQIQKRVA